MGKGKRDHEKQGNLATDILDIKYIANAQAHQASSDIA